MTLIRQVIRDLVKDAGWVVFYGFLTAMSIMAFVLVGLSYQHVASQNDAIRRFTQNDVSMGCQKHGCSSAPPLRRWVLH